MAATAMTDTHASDLRALATTALIVVTVFVYDHWLLDARTFFYADDWQWLWRAEFVPWSLMIIRFCRRPFTTTGRWCRFRQAALRRCRIDHRIFQFVLLSIHALIACCSTPWRSRTSAAVARCSRRFLRGMVLRQQCGDRLHRSNLRRARRDLVPCHAVAISALAAERDAAAVRAGRHGVLLPRKPHERVRSGHDRCFVSGEPSGGKAIARATMKQLAPYFVVFVILAIRYAQLLPRIPLLRTILIVSTSRRRA